MRFFLNQIRNIMKQTAQEHVDESVATESGERRRHSRFRAASTIRFSSPDLFGLGDVRTEDVSCSGFSFLARNPHAPVARFYCGLVIPDNGTGKLALLCRARVVSTASQEQGLFRVGCRIEDYSILPDAATFHF
jgi:hypothetical protein